MRALADEWQSHSIPGTTDWDYGQDVREALYSHRWYLRPDLSAEQGASGQGDHTDEFEAWIGRAMIGEEQGWGA